MPKTIAQASPPNSGASRAADFQPPTGNPQTVPGEIFPESPGLQTQGAYDILQNSKATISVPNDPAAPPPDVAVAKSSNGPMIGFVLIVLAIFLISSWRRYRLRNQSAPVIPLPASVPEPVKKTASTKSTKTKKSTKKAKPAPKKSKRR